MTQIIAQTKFKHFDKYNFIKSFIAATTDKTKREEKEREAEIIADAIDDTQEVLFEHLVTKEDARATELRLEEKIKTSELHLEEKIKSLESSTKKDLKLLESRLTIKLTVIMASLLTLLPLITKIFCKDYSIFCLNS